MKLFVYGTLRQGAPMHGLIEREVHSLGPARVRARLLDLGHFPGLVRAGQRPGWVRGELYSVDESAAAQLFERLDRYEGDAFERAEGEVDADGTPARAWLYFYTGDSTQGSPVASGDWLAHVNGV